MRRRDPVRKILDKKGRDVWSIEPTASVFEALKLLAEKRIGALPVIADGKLVGMFSERDYARKVILKGLSSRRTPVRDIMVETVFTVTLDESVADCMQLMTERRVRHLPVLEGDTTVGVISIGDLVNWIISAQEETIHYLEDYIVGKYPG